MKACIELMRVAKSGYIETPSLIWETLFGRHFHKWVVKKDKGILVFKKKKIEPNTFDGDLLHREIPVFKKMFNENKDIFSVRFHWENNFKIQCIKYG